MSVTISSHCQLIYFKKSNVVQSFEILTFNTLQRNQPNIIYMTNSLVNFKCSQAIFAFIYLFQFAITRVSFSTRK